MNIDAFDHRILEALRENARMSNVELGRRVGLSASACARRIRDMEDKGVIRNYTVVLNSSAKKSSKPVFILAKLSNPTGEAMRRFEDAVRNCQEVRECFLITGEADYLLRIEIDGLEDFERVHSKVLSKLPGISSLLSNFTIRSAFSY